MTGHQDLGDADTVSWVRRAMVLQVARCQASSGLTSLAAGADQLFAEALLALGVPFDAVLPCADYERAFASEPARASYRSLLARARGVHQLSDRGPGQAAFLAAGCHIVAHCDLLLAVWDGLPARGRGGTGDIVADAVARRRAWVHVDPRARAVRVHA